MRRPVLGALLAAIAAVPLAAQQRSLDSATIAALRWRNIGPANMGGRIADIEGIPSPSKTFYVAAAAGGLWKTINGGTTFQPIFDNERVISMGDLAIAPSDTNVLYLGTGEQNSRNSISPGGGVYKSTDGGKSWKFVGLKETEHVGRIVVHPKDPNTAYVAALGAAWRPNKERGLYKTTDGGTTWQLVKFVSDKAGFIDVALDPRDPNVVWASSYERQRGPYFLQSGGPGSALWKSTDAGATWTKVEGNGFPTQMKGRINFAISLSKPDVMYAMVEADTLPNATKAQKPQTRPSGLYRSQDGGKTWEKTNGENTRPFYYNQVRIDPKNPDRVYWSSTPVKFSDDGGKTARNATQGIHVDHHAMWIDPNDPEHFIVGDDGGVSQTWDKGGTYDFLNTFAIGQFYNVSFDMQIPYRVCGGLQDNGSWCAVSRRRGGITNMFWFNVGGGDGFGTAQDPTDPN
ncbi:MAG: glycosyl hydrolase, partial [Gemmatimonadetes bacterium]|nr:glycosyl hydrolase [Gemmatimonadota bacterium]